MPGEKIELEEQRSMELNILQEAAAFCEKNRLRYYLAAPPPKQQKSRHVFEAFRR